MSFNILDNLYTTEDALRLEDELNLVKNSIFKKAKGTGFLEIIKEKVSKPTCDALTELISGSPDNPDLINKQIDSFIAELKAIPIITIKIGFDPTYTQIANISKHANKICGKRVLIDIFFDPQIVSGAEIVSNGQFYDGTTNKSFYLALDTQTKTVPREGDFLIGRLK